MFASRSRVSLINISGFTYYWLYDERDGGPESEDDGCEGAQLRGDS